jgi:Ca2+-binding EF-hand superfamily protein
MMMVVYVFAILGMEMIVGSSGEALSREAQGNFHSMGGSILTFMQMMALDSSAGIYRPLIEANAVLSILFLAFFMIGPIALMSIVTAIMVESSMRTANEDMEAKKTWEKDKMQKTRKSIVPKLRTLLETLDTDCSGDVVLDELLMAPKELQDQVAQICDLETVEEVFNLLDVDGNGAVDIDELVNGIMPRSRISSCSYLSSK